MTLVDEVRLVGCNFWYTKVPFPDGQKDRLSTHHLAPNGKTSEPSVTSILRKEAPTLIVKHPLNIHTTREIENFEKNYFGK